MTAVVEKWESFVGGPTNEPRALGRVIRREWTKDEEQSLVEHREIVAAIAVCPECESKVELLADTDGWEQRDGRWRHLSYGPAMGECCNSLITDDDCDGCRVWELP